MPSEAAISFQSEHVQHRVLANDSSWSDLHLSCAIQWGHGNSQRNGVTLVDALGLRQHADNPASQRENPTARTTPSTQHISVCGQSMCQHSMQSQPSLNTDHSKKHPTCSARMVFSPAYSKENNKGIIKLLCLACAPSHRQQKQGQVFVK